MLVILRIFHKYMCFNIRITATFALSLEKIVFHKFVWFRLVVSNVKGLNFSPFSFCIYTC